MRLPIKSEVFSRAVEGIISREELKKKLSSGRKLRIKFGADVTATSLHIGHAVNLWKMRELQDHGHKVVFLVGDFTTKIGDPTGRLEPRRVIQPQNINTWAKNFVAQVKVVLRTDPKVFEVRKNSEWYSKMKTEKFLELLSLFTHARLIERDMFQKRIKEGKEILIPELFYPVLQGYDSFMVKSDLTVIGTDQLFNEGVGRFLQERFGQEPQVIVTTTLTPGLSGGPKMSKSLGNYIGLADSPQDKFGKAMRLLDSLIIPYLEVYTDVPPSTIRRLQRRLQKGGNPMEAKLFLAGELVKRYHGRTAAEQERRRFLRIFSRRETPDNMPTVKIRTGSWDPAELLVASGLVHSKSEARRLIHQRAVKISGKTLEGTKNVSVFPGTVLQVGHRRFTRILGKSL